MKKIIGFLLFILGLTSVFMGCTFLESRNHNVINDGFLYIRTGADMDEVMDSLQGKLNHPDRFLHYAQTKGFADVIKPGKYKLKKEDTNKALLNRLMSGAQTDQSVMIGNYPTIFHLAGGVSIKLEVDSTQIVNAIMAWAAQKDTTLDPETVKMYFVPNTYNFRWNATAEEFVGKMINEFEKVWTSERQQKAEAMNFTPLQVFTLASIVQMEASKVDEQPKVAQVYLNRLKKGMKLEADPTSIYAYKLENGFNHRIQRVYMKHLATPSAYNTYKIKGLPPAPICLPNMSAVDAVLQPEPHEFIYFCADPDRPGYHSYTTNYAVHLQNAAKYRKWLQERGIK
ncbi:MAG: endolytic transglycosylase MltG [Weeksellaceae bacterium]